MYNLSPKGPSLQNNEQSCSTFPNYLDKLKYHRSDKMCLIVARNDASVLMAPITETGACSPSTVHSLIKTCVTIDSEKLWVIPDENDSLIRRKSICSLRGREIPPYALDPISVVRTKEITPVLSNCPEYKSRDCDGERKSR